MKKNIKRLIKTHEADIKQAQRWEQSCAESGDYLEALYANFAQSMHIMVIDDLKHLLIKKKR